MNANQIINALTFAEVSSQYEADTRRVIRAEREQLSAALQSGDKMKIGMALIEAKRVAEMWGVKIA